FVHPRCPCSRATVANLARLLAHCPGPVEADVLFYRPGDAEEAWQPTDLWESAAAVPGVGVGWDEDGVEAARFGARTSGHVVIYDSEGVLRFKGGITSSRGHEDDNPGLDSAAAALGSALPGADHPVFGCPLNSPCPRCREEDRP